jgi:ABC-type antimicrobial peptide transport system ATPase subunit
MALLDVSDLSVRFGGDDGAVQAVDRVSFGLERGEVLGSSASRAAARA